jgi:hypothetical protein
LGIVFDGIGRTQRFAFQARCAEQIARMGNERSFRATNRSMQETASLRGRALPQAAAFGANKSARPGNHLVSW